MATILPFKALRPRDELAPRVASVPYDVINTEEARELARGNNLSFLHVCRSEIDLEPGIDPYDPRVYAKARENLDKLVADKIMRYDETPILYVYSQKMGDHFQAGITALTSVEEYDRDVIKKHEKTRKDKEDDRTRAILALKAHSEPVFITYRAHPVVEEIVARTMAGSAPVNRFTSRDDIEHTLWRLSSVKDIAALQKAFAGMKCLYIADGHHRSASASRVAEHLRKANPSHTGREEYNFFLSVLFPDKALSIMPYNRAVKDLNGMTPEAFLKKVCARFDLLPDPKAAPDRPRTFSLYVAGKWHTLAVRAKDVPKKDPFRSLDVSLLQDLLLSPLLKIKDPRTDKRIDFIGGIRGTDELKRLVDSGRAAAAFSMVPVTVGQIMAIADKGGIMPPKSTWFEPKLRSGLFVHTF